MSLRINRQVLLFMALGKQRENNITIDNNSIINEAHENDLFIAYFCGKGEKAAGELYDKLEKTGKYKCVFHDATNGYFYGTPGVIREKCKAVLVVVDDDAMYKSTDTGVVESDIGKIRLTKVDPKTQELAPKEVLREIAAATHNEFIAPYLKSRSTKTVPIKLLYVGKRGDFNPQVAFRDEDFKLKFEAHFAKKAESARKEEYEYDGFDKDIDNPFKGLTMFNATEGDCFSKICSWIDGIKKDYRVRYGIFKNAHLYWVGTRQSDCAHCEDMPFFGSVCLFGDNNPDKNIYAYRAQERIDHNAINQAADEFVFNAVKEIADKDDKAVFYCYNQAIVYNTFIDGENPYLRTIKNRQERYIDRFICLNSESVLKKFKNKQNFLGLAALGDENTHFNVIPSVRLKGYECSYRKLFEKFDELFKGKPNENDWWTEDMRFVVQAPVGSGGSSTFILDKTYGSATITNDTSDSTDYICTIFQENNVPVNVHAIICDVGKDEPEVLISVPSIQLLRKSGNRLIYRGADFIEAKRIPEKAMNDFIEQARRACVKLYKNKDENGNSDPFIGICGIDGIICYSSEFDKKEPIVYLLEVNTRFQASSGLLNRAMIRNQKEGGCGHSLQYLNLFAWNKYIYSEPCKNLLCSVTEGKHLDGGKYFANIDVHYSNYSYINNETNCQGRHLLEFCKKPYDSDAVLKEKQAFCDKNYIVEYETDGLDFEKTVEPESGLIGGFEHDAYLYRIVFSENLAWVNTESFLYFNENVIDEDLFTRNVITGNTCFDEKRGKVFADYNSSSVVSKRERMIRVKVALLIQGVYMDNNTICMLEENNYLRPGTFQSIDIYFCDKDKFENYVVNAPVMNPKNTDEAKNNAGIKYTGMTPFVIKTVKEGDVVYAALYYYGVKIDDVKLFPQDSVSGYVIKDNGSVDTSGRKPTAKEIPFSDIAYLSTDRLRVHLTNACKFKVHRDENGNYQGCKFCGITCGEEERLKNDGTTFTEGNVQTVVENYVKKYDGKDFEGKKLETGSYPALRHFLIGGQTADVTNEAVAKRLVKTVNTINRAGKGKPIYAMIIPCGPQTVYWMKHYGLTQLAFNLEIWDDEIAFKVMPGKRDKSGSPNDNSNEFIGNDRKGYLEALSSARSIMKAHESVKSMLLIGLEPLANTKHAVKELVSRDIQPMLSIFRPMPGTPFAGYMSPQITDVVEMFEAAETICAEKEYSGEMKEKNQKRIKPFAKIKKMHLGPDCVCCQNNTVALPYSVTRSEIENTNK